MELADLDDLLARRHSCRAFRPDPVPRADIERILSSARRVPSWCNAQPWQVVVTSGDETDRFRTALLHEAATGAHAPDLPFPTSYSGVYQQRRRTCGWALYEAVGVEKGDRAGSAREMMKNFALFGAPHCAIVSSPAELGSYGALDCGGFVTAFTLAAQALGIATIPQAAVASYSPFLHRHFGIPDDRLVLCAISFGYADPDHPANAFRTDRAELDEFVDWRG
ncbi:nitroreductase [Ruegeria sediminis]|uniref:Nitroreductase n=1 Tax=Ruegeria sediminis TaxID=2583820 RepID=A0ABY2WY66_9RHOB|nr:nitroreductase [Ruegeria sediminis]TMV07812.1 nitroreductase [Ruegeria sediminis]